MQKHIMGIHQQLKQARINAGLSQLDIANITGLKQEAISRAEQGKLSIKTMIRIAKAIGIKSIAIE